MVRCARCRSDFGASSWNGVVYIMGGLSNNDTTLLNGTVLVNDTTVNNGGILLDNTVLYDAVYSNITEVAKMPEPRWVCAARAVGSHSSIIAQFR
jgi:hypothetical protein